MLLGLASSFGMWAADTVLEPQIKRAQFNIVLQKINAVGIGLSEAWGEIMCLESHCYIEDCLS